LFDSAVRFHQGIDYDLVLVSPRSTFLARTVPFPRSRLYQVAGVDGVKDVSPIYIQSARYHDQTSAGTHVTTLAMGIDPSQDNFRLSGVDEFRHALKREDTVIIDRYSRKEFAPGIEAVIAGRPVELQLNDRHVNVLGVYSLGTSFGIDGTVITSDLNFRRIFPQRPASNIDLGLVRLNANSELIDVEDKLRSLLPNDVLVLTRDEYIAKELAYWNSSTPIGYVFTLGAVIGVIVGLIIVYQILFSDVQSHLGEYATLKAMGYSNGFLRWLVMRESIYLAILGFLPAFGLALLLYDQALQATQLPMQMTLSRAITVLAVTIAMCAASGSFAMRKLSRVDPAEVF